MITTILLWILFSFISAVVCFIVYTVTFIVGFLIALAFMEKINVTLAIYTPIVVGSIFISVLSILFSPWFLMISVPQYFIIGHFVGNELMNNFEWH